MTDTVVFDCLYLTGKPAEKRKRHGSVTLYSNRPVWRFFLLNSPTVNHLQLLLNTIHMVLTDLFYAIFLHGPTGPLLKFPAGQQSNSGPVLLCFPFVLTDLILKMFQNVLKMSKKKSYSNWHFIITMFYKFTYKDIFKTPWNKEKLN